MRSIATALIAFLLSLLAGGMVAQQVAISAGAREEFILVFLFAVVVAVVVTGAFLSAQFRAEPASAIGATGRSLIILLLGAVAVLFVWSYYAAAGDSEKFRRDLPVIAGMSLPSLAIILVQWWFTRWRTRRAAVRFGREPA